MQLHDDRNDSVCVDECVSAAHTDMTLMVKAYANGHVSQSQSQSQSQSS
jgi:hypothetical protein